MNNRFNGRMIRTFTAATFSVLVSSAVLAQPAPPATVEPAQSNLTASQLEALVAPISGVPQSMIPALMDACRHPADIAEAAAALARPEPELKSSWNTGVQFLARYAPDLLGILARDLRATAALGDAYVRQPNDVWRALGAVDVRARQAAAPAQPAAAAPARAPAASPARPAASAPPPAPAAPAPQAASSSPAPALPPCEAYGSPLRGAARGAARGAVVGAISENAGRGAAIGAAAGGVGGAARRGAARRSGACY